MKPHEEAVPVQTQCRHLRSKEMFYQAAGEPDDAFCSGVFWCTKTHEGFGPDGEPVGKTRCCTSRTCYVN